MKRYGIITLVIGERRTGKTTKVKELIGQFNVPKYVYDVRQEYYSDGFNMPIDEFITLVKNKQNSVIVFEEATIFFKGRSSKDMTDILTGASHNRNAIFLVFHSFRAVPVDILELVDFIVFGKTKDRSTLIYDKYKDDPVMLNMFDISQTLKKYEFVIKRYE